MFQGFTVFQVCSVCISIYYYYYYYYYCDDVRVVWCVEMEVTKTLEIDESQRDEINNWFGINAGLCDQKILLKPAHLYATFVSMGLIS